MAGTDRAISVLRLFTLSRPSWSVEEAGTALGVSTASAYRYFAALVDGGLLTPSTKARYILGPAIIQYDRQIQLTDPMLRAARPIMNDAIRTAPPDTTVLLCRIFRDKVLCVHQIGDDHAQPAVSYERGRPMQLFVGATSKVILAHLPSRDLRNLYEHDRDRIEAAGLGRDWSAFKAALSSIRKAGYAVTSSEVDLQRIGVAAPILNDRRAIGSLSYVIPAAHESSTTRLIPLAIAGARAIERAMQDEGTLDGQSAKLSVESPA
ncbi:MAG TPA: IclR family transcriptional regulator C-terminal domain-containing protein [Beijerinckiaceae bacterium]|nr:IclR family transcriptional regulator C-terminal domain-containing protein [Beijerinckiaceae bacterium]